MQEPASLTASCNAVLQLMVLACCMSSGWADHAVVMQAGSAGDTANSEALEVAEGCLELQIALVDALQQWPQVRSSYAIALS